MSIVFDTHGTTVRPAEPNSAHLFSESDLLAGLGDPAVPLDAESFQEEPNAYTFVCKRRGEHQLLTLGQVNVGRGAFPLPRAPISNLRESVYLPERLIANTLVQAEGQMSFEIPIPGNSWTGPNRQAIPPTFLNELGCEGSQFIGSSVEGDFGVTDDGVLLVKYRQAEECIARSEPLGTLVGAGALPCGCSLNPLVVTTTEVFTSFDCITCR